jgi:hypothetical protein
MGSYWVSNDALFTGTPNKALIEQAARDIGLQGVRGGFTNTAADGTKYKKDVIFTPAENQNDPNIMTYYHRDEVARLARQVMILQARQLCNTPPQGITQAIMSGQYMPHLADLRLVEHSFGAPEKWPPGELERLRGTGTIPPGEGNPPAQYDIYRHGQVTAHQSQEWAKMFGALDQRFVDEMVKPNMASVAKTHQSPLAYYTVPGGYDWGRGAAYLVTRDTTYRDRQLWLAHTGQPACSVPGVSAQPQGSGPAGSGSAAATTAPPTVPPASGSAGTSSGSSSTACTANTAFGPNGCARDQIKANAETATGSPAAPPAAVACTANTALNGGCNKPAATAKP